MLNDGSCSICVRAGLLAVLSLLLSRSEPLRAQTCTAPVGLSSIYAWAPNSDITVNIDPSSYTSQEITAIQGAFIAWQNSNVGGITFFFTSNSTPISGQSTYQVSKGSLSSGIQGSTGGTKSGNYRSSADTITNVLITNITALRQLMAHEIGHTFGLDDCPSCRESASVMAPANGGMNDTSGLSAPSGCDKNDSQELFYSGGGCTGTPPDCTGTAAFCSNGQFTCGNTNQCGGNIPSCPPRCVAECQSGYWVCNASPIIIDPFGNGFRPTSAAGGVKFRVYTDGPEYQMSWPEPTARNGWLALDRNGNGVIDSFEELFGNITPQPAGNDQNGYNALAVFDLPENGGNGNGSIDPGDAVYKRLRVWIDDNHNGISEPSELHTLDELGVAEISLRYKSVIRTDQNGNVFRYTAKIKDQAGRKHDSSYDVFIHFDY